MAKDLKNSGDEKKKKYFVRAIELFTKVLSIDPKNVFAAQGLAIIYIENKELNKGLDILRKIRDSLNDISVYLNMGHVLTELNQFSKAIENYEIALIRFASGQDPKILGFLGRVWYLRATAEKNLAYLKKALEYSEEALNKASGINSMFKFNVAFIQFQIADFITKLSIEQRSVDDINDGISGLNSAIQIFNELASDEESHPPYPKTELKARANLGTNSLLNRLNVCLEETQESILEMDKKLEGAKRIREEAEAKRVEALAIELAEKKAKDEELAIERAKLQEQAQQWAEESRANLLVEESDNDNFGDEDAKKGKKGKKKAKGKKKKDFINDSDDDNATPDDATADEDGNEKDTDEKDEKDTKKTVKKGGKRRRRVVEDEDDEVDEAPSKKKTFKSAEIVQDSDDDDDDDLF